MSEVLVDARGLSLEEVNAKIREAIAKGLKVKVRNAERVHGLAAGIDKGEVEVEGDVGDYAAMLIGRREQKERGEPGPKIVINGNAGAYLADNAWAGEVIVKGSAGDYAGVYAYGGTIVIHGNAGNGVGQLLKGATIIVNGSVGDVVGLYMVGGTIVITGDAGEALGDWIIRGEIFIAGKYKSLGNNAQEVSLTDQDKEKLKTLLGRYGINVDVEKFKKIVPVKVRPFYG